MTTDPRLQAIAARVERVKRAGIDGVTFTSSWDDVSYLLSLLADAQQEIADLRLKHAYAVQHAESVEAQRDTLRQALEQAEADIADMALTIGATYQEDR